MKGTGRKDGSVQQDLTTLRERRPLWQPICKLTVNNSYLNGEVALKPRHGQIFNFYVKIRKYDK